MFARPAPAALQTAFPGLTVRESEILSYVAAGLPNAAIAEALGVSEKTVKNGLLMVPVRMGFSPDDMGGSLRVRLALAAQGIARA